MNKNILTVNETLIQLEKMRILASKDTQLVLDKISKSIDWELLAGTIADKLAKYRIKFQSSSIVFVIKSLALEILFDIQINKIHSEISDRQSYQKFLGVHSALEIPESALCVEVKNALLEKGLYGNMVSLLETVLEENQETKFQKKHEGNIESKLNQFEDKLRKFKEYDFSEDNTSEQEILISEKLKDNQQDIRNITKSKYDISHVKSMAMNEKLKEVNDKIDNLFKTQILKEKTVDQKTDEIEQNIPSDLNDIRVELQRLTPDTGTGETENNREKEVYKRLFDSFYNQLQAASKIAEKKTPEISLKETSKKEVQEETAEKLKKIEDEIKKIYDRINQNDETIPAVNFVTPEISKIEVEKKVDFRPQVEIKKEPAEKIYKEEDKIIPTITAKEVEERGVIEEESPIIDLRKKKRYHIFNNTNLTEDYELGIRFYKLGFKTAFINMKADEKDENSRIATAEYFPNTFWGSVKQRSRWIAGIVFQNWKIHKWEGNLRTKYFLFRDRKALFSFFGIFLSNVVFAYFLYCMFGLIFNYSVPEPTVDKGTVLWYLMIATLFFLITRIVHRFAATYNWYGFKYAATSIVRLIFDNLINLFATARAIKVYNINKKQIVWDSTDHY
ncbi:MAG TPA: glycosyltransferase family 2 protein [Ignavibacteria bacterium]